MKKILIVFGILIIIILNLWQGVGRHESSENINDAIIKAGNSISNILYTEDLNNQKFALFVDKRNYLCAALIDKTALGFKYHLGNKISLSSKNNENVSYLVNNNEDAYSVFWGILSNSSINRLHLIDGDKEYECKFIYSKYGQIFFAYVDRFNNKTIKILGYGLENKVIYESIVRIN